jgi:hypothetical protein
MTIKLPLTIIQFLHRAALLAVVMTALLWCNAAICADWKVPTLRNGEMPIGSLGAPLGDYLTIEGTRAPKDDKNDACTLRVDTVNGKKLASPVDIWIDNIEDLPERGRCILKGYETVRTVGIPPAVEEAAKEKGQDIAAPQRWSILLYFVPTSVVSPETLKLREHDEME